MLPTGQKVATNTAPKIDLPKVYAKDDGEVKKQSVFFVEPEEKPSRNLHAPVPDDIDDNPAVELSEKPA